MNIHFTLVDIVAGSILLISACLGVWRGLVKELLALVGWVAAAWVGYHYAQWLSEQWLTSVPGGEMTRLALAFILLFIGTMVICSLTGRFLSKLLHQAGLSPMDRTLGFSFGLIRGVLVIIVLSTLAALTSVTQTNEWRQAWSLPAIDMVTGISRAWLPDEWAAQVDVLKK